MPNGNKIDRRVKSALQGSPLYAPAKVVKESLRRAHFSMAQVSDKLVRPAPHEVFLSLTSSSGRPRAVPGAPACR